MLAAGTCALAGEPPVRLAGAPPLVRHLPDIEVAPQNFALAQDAAGIAYLANAAGLLVYDASRWRLIEMPNGDLVRSLAAAGERMYVGGYDLFGYVERDATGLERFHDLTPAFAGLLDGERFADIWHIAVTRHGVFFVAVKHLMLYEPDTGRVRLWRHDGRFGAVGVHDGRPVVQFRGEGLRVYDGHDWQARPAAATPSELIYAWVTLADGRLLALEREGGWRTFDGDALTRLAVPAPLGPSSHFEDGVTLDDGVVALAGNDGALQLFAPGDETTQVRRLDVDSGMLTGLIRAADGGLLAATNLALVHVGWPSPLTVVGASEGLSGTVHALRSWRGVPHALTANGVFRLQRDALDSSRSRFVRQSWTDNEAWDLLAIDDGEALLAESYRLRVGDGERWRAIGPSPYYPRHFWRSRFDPERIYVATEFGLGVLRRVDGRWTLPLAQHAPEAIRPESLVETADGELWIASQRGGVERIRLSPGLDAVAEHARHGPASGLPALVAPSVEPGAAPGSVQVVAADGSRYAWDGNAFVALPVNDDMPAGAQLALSDGTRIAWSDRRLAWRRPGQPWQALPVAAQLRGLLGAASVQADGRVAFGMTDALLLLDPSVPLAGPAPVAALLRSLLRVTADGALIRLAVDGEQPHIERDEALRVEWAVPHFGDRAGLEMRTRFGAGEGSWTPWSDALGWTFAQLEPREYRLSAQMRNDATALPDPPAVSWAVPPPWHATAWGRTVLGVPALLGVVLCTALVARWRMRLLRGENIRLERLIAARTAELRGANSRLAALAHIDGLTGLANRRRLDAWLDDAWRHAGDAGEPLAALIVDLDHFKTLNDTRGHLGADAVLVDVAALIDATVSARADAGATLVARYGGDEFVALLCGCTLGDAQVLGSTIGRSIARQLAGVTVSIGVASETPDGTKPPASLLERADAALYAAKRDGRNRVSAARREVARGSDARLAGSLGPR